MMERYINFVCSVFVMFMVCLRSERLCRRAASASTAEVLLRFCTHTAERWQCIAMNCRCGYINCIRGTFAHVLLQVL